MPAKNTGKYISECLDSILAQSYLNWELIVVDDGSTDKTFEIANRYAEDRRIRVFSQSASGIIPALRLACEKSTGKMITRMDSDDIMSQNKIEKLAALLMKHGDGHIATGSVEYFSQTNPGEGYLKYARWLNSLNQNNSHFSEIYKECCIPSPCWMLWRQDLDACEAFTPDTYPEDYDLTFRFYRRGLKPVGCTDILHRWRDHENRSSRTMEFYRENSFINLKVNYFLSIDYDNSTNLVLWGAGKKAKKIAELLNKQNISFFWVCNNSKKIGQEIYKVLMHDSADFNFSNKKVIVTLANDIEQTKARLHLEGFNNCRAYFFC